MAAEPVASAATEAVAKGIALGGYFDILLDVVKATPAL